MADELVGFPKLKVEDLKRELQKRGLPVRGTKAELQERLLEYLKQDVSLGQEANEKKIEEEEEEEEEADDSNVLDENNPLENSAEEDDVAVTAAAELDDALEVKSPDIDLNDEEPKKSAQVEKPTKPKPVAMKKVIASSEEEKRVARTKRFGEVTNEVDKKKLRAERFKTGDSSTEVIYEGKSVTGDELEKLKKRADRFGVVSPIMGKLDSNDRKAKRQERFGIVTSVSTKPLTDSEAARKKKRMERFGQV